MNWRDMVARHLQRFFTPTCFQDVVAAAPQYSRHEVSDSLFVLHQQDRFGASFGSQAANILGRCILCNVDAWEIHVKSASPPRLTVDVDVAPILLDDAINRRQAEPGTFARLLRREEGL